MIPKKIALLNTFVHSLTMDETMEIVNNTIQKNEQIHHTVINAGKVVALQNDPELARSVNEADLINADGMAIVWAAKVLGHKLPERVAGIDLMENLIKLAFEKKYKVFFFGAKEEVVKKTVEIYSEKYSSDLVAGYRNGYFKKEDEQSIAQQIADSGAHLLFVAITSPTKENFLFHNKEILQKVNFTMGVGGSFDVVAGKVKRAPVWMQKIGLEWFYRFLQEPKRMWKRYLVGNYKFVTLLIRSKINVLLAKK